MSYPYDNPYGSQYRQPQYGQQPQQMYAQAPMPQQQAAPAFTCKPVASREEALGTPTDYTSSGTVMPDLGHGIIYLKRFNPSTGTSEFYDFAYKPPEPPQKPQEYATVQMLDDAFKTLRGELDALSKPRGKKGGADE